jgi:maltokinase
MIDVSTDLLAAHLPNQRWFAGDKPPRRLKVAVRRTLRAEPPWLESLEVVADDVRYHLVVGARPDSDDLSFLHADEARIGAIAVDGVAATAYDATLDSALAVELARKVAPDEPLERARPLGVEQSHTSVVLDERLLLKLYRRLTDTPNADVAVPEALAAAGCPSVVPLVGVWREDNRELATLQPFLAEATDGWQLALTSLRDYLAWCDTGDLECEPAAAGGDFGGEAERLGAAIAALHEALADVFGRSEGDAKAWYVAMRAQLERSPVDDDDRTAIDARLLRVCEVADSGPAMRVHGDLHLGQTLRSANGWVIVDFEGEPARPEEERDAPSSSLRDVAGVLRSLHYAAAAACRERDDDASAPQRAAEWETRNRAKFLAGYMPGAERARLLPHNPESVDAVLDAFELDKAVYELAYEHAHRPSWSDIPLAAIRRILGGQES